MAVRPIRFRIAQEAGTMNKRLAVLSLAVLASLAETGCATWGPTWSEISGARYNVTTLNRRPAFVQKIDGSSAFVTNPIKIDPGKHEIELSSPQPGWAGGGPLRTMTLNVEPCTRYYINAQFENPVQPDWQPVIDYTEPIAGCKVVVATK